MGRLSKLGIAAQVALMLALSVGIVLALVWLSRRPGLRYRADWSFAGANTLDPQTLELLQRSEDPIGVDIFLRHANPHLSRPLHEAHVMMVKMLSEAVERVGEAQLELEVHDMSDAAAVGARMQELGTSNTQCVIVGRGDRRVVLDYMGQLADIDVGNPDRQSYQPATLRRFQGEAAFAGALAQLATDDRPKVLFSTGHGEVSIEDAGQSGLSLLIDALAHESFEVGTWSGANQGPVPEDCSVLAVMGPEQPLDPEEVALVQAFVRRGGRLLVVGGHRLYQGPGSGAELLAEWGVRVLEAVVCRPYLDAASGQFYDGVPECGEYTVGGSSLNSQHPLTEPLVRGGRGVRFNLARALQRIDGVGDSVLWDLVSAPKDSWGELPDAEGRVNFALDQGREQLGPFRLAVAVELAPDAARPEQPVGRVVGTSCQAIFWNHYFATNQDFLVNTFNWLSARDVRIRIQPRITSVASLDMQSGTSFHRFTLLAWWGLPGVCVGLGLGTWFLRRRS